MAERFGTHSRHRRFALRSCHLRLHGCARLVSTVFIGWIASLSSPIHVAGIKTTTSTTHQRHVETVEGAASQTNLRRETINSCIEIIQLGLVHVAVQIRKNCPHT